MDEDFNKLKTERLKKIEDKIKEDLKKASLPPLKAPYKKNI